MGSEQRDNKFKIDGKVIGQVTIVGVILRLEQQNTNLNYMIDDGSGKINVRIYDDQDGDAPQRMPLQEGTYVRVIGNIRSLNGNLAIVGFTLLPITDFNELTFHQLEVIKTHLSNTRGPADGSAATMGMGATKTSAPMPTSTMGMNSNVIGADGFSAGGVGAGGNSDFSQIQAQVMRVFEENDDDDSGTNINVVHTRAGLERIALYGRFPP